MERSCYLKLNLCHCFTWWAKDRKIRDERKSWLLSGGTVVIWIAHSQALFYSRLFGNRNRNRNRNNTLCIFLPFASVNSFIWILYQRRILWISLKAFIANKSPHDLGTLRGLESQHIHTHTYTNVYVSKMAYVFYASNHHLNENEWVRINYE